MSFVFPKLRFGLSVILLLVALCTALQFVFLGSFGSGLPLSADELLQAFYVGFKDVHLFEESNRVLRETAAPFFAIIHLADNHQPYTIPADNRGFVPSVIPHDVAVENGFDGVEGFNSFRLMDHSLGFLMKIVSAVLTPPSFR